MTGIPLLLALWAAHFVCDFPLQSDYIAWRKAPVTTGPDMPWYYPMTAHAATHALAVGLLTGSVGLALAEFAAHFVIDLWKCQGLTTIHQDQLAHLGCKLLWWMFFSINGALASLEAVLLTTPTP